MSDTEAPTSSATKENLNKPTGLTELQQQFVSLMIQYYGVTGKVMTPPVGVEQYLFKSEEDFNEYFENDLVQAALSERGMIVREGDADAKDHWAKTYALTPLQLMVANAMLDLNDTRSYKKKLQDHQVATSTYQTWLKDSVFSQYLRDSAEAMLGDTQHEAMLALMDKVKMGDMSAIKYYHEMTGRFVQATTGANAGSDAINFRAALVKILEIINDEVTDPQMAANIADRIKGLIGAQRMANELMSVDDEPITVPKIRKLGAAS